MNKELKKTIKKGIIFLIVFSIIFSAYYLLSVKYTKSENSLTWIHGVYQIKDSIAKNISTQKILLVGDSNVHFGINAQKIENETKIKTLNYGIQGGLRAYHLDRAKQILNPNDIVILSLEYEFYTYEEKKYPFSRQYTYITYILTHDKPYFNNLSTYQKFTYQTIGLEELYKNIKISNSKPIQNYDLKDINKWGDQTYYKDANFSFNKHPFTIPENYEKNYNNYIGIKKLKEFIFWAKNNNITILIDNPSLYNNSKLHSKEYKEYFNIINQFYSQNNISIITKPVESLYELEYMYDTRYHLNEKGKEIRTQKIIEFLTQ